MYQTVSAPLITFVVPAYNAVSTLEAAVRSLSEQTSDDWEAIIVDDGSVDGTGEMADELARGDGRIKALHQGNAGVSAARNAAIAAASGEYLAFLDVDDTVVSNFVEKAGTLLGRRPVRPDVVALAYRALPRGKVFGYGRFHGNASEFLELSLSNRYATFPLLALPRFCSARRGEWNPVHGREADRRGPGVHSEAALLCFYL